MNPPHGMETSQQATMSKPPGTPPIAAGSLSSVLELASKPPDKFPRRFREPGHQPLVLHLLKVPGSEDLILTPLVPVSPSRVTSEDILSSIYYFRRTPLPSDLSSAHHKKDSFTFTIIRRSPLDSSQASVGEVTSHPLPPPSAPPQGQTWDGLFELEKPPVEIALGTEGYAGFAERGDEGVFKSNVVFVRKKWYKPKKAKTGPGEEEKSRLPPGYSFAVPWFVESVGVFEDGRWAKCHGDGSGRAVFEEDTGGRKLDCWLYPPTEAGQKGRYKICHMKLTYSGQNALSSKRNEPSAELAVITVYEPGLLMLDLVVSATVSVAWRKWCGWTEKQIQKTL